MANVNWRDPGTSGNWSSTAAHEWYRNDIRARRTPGCPTIIVQTRWHEDDLTGRLLLQEPGIGDRMQKREVTMPFLGPVP